MENSNEILLQLLALNRRMDAIEKKFTELEMDLRFKESPQNDPLRDLPGRGKTSAFGKMMGL